MESIKSGTKHWSEQEAKAVLEELAASGLGITEFCRRHGINPARLRRWQQRLNNSMAQLPAFLPVQVVGGESSPAKIVPAIEVVASHGWVVRIPPGCTMTAVRSIFTALREALPC